MIDNRPTGELVVWSVVSFVMLLAGVGALTWYYAVQKRKEPHIEDVYPEKDPLLALSATPSMKATLKYFWVVAALIVVQVGLGAITAHYAVEGGGFYGIPLQEWLPYSVAQNMAHSIRYFMDCYCLACDRLIYGTCCIGL